MKFLLTLTVLASATGAFANDRFIKCWETTQGERGRPEYVFKVNHGPGYEENYRFLSLVHPFTIPVLNERNGCLKPQGGVPPMDNPNHVKFCETDGQRINGLVPIEVERGQWDETVYCEAEIKRFFRNHNDVY